MLETRQRIAKSSITPSICLNHGPTMSMYYEDPDHNAVELFYDNKFSEEQILAFDPAELLQELRTGKIVAELTAWSPRGE
jgi:hypothetical protein